MATDDGSLKSIAEPNTVLRGLVGSSVHGLVLSGTDDRDEMGICVEPRGYVVGFGKFEQWVYRSAAERDGHAGARSRAGDLDLTIYSLRKWARLALQGNPTVLLLRMMRSSSGPRWDSSSSSSRRSSRRDRRAGDSSAISKRNGNASSASGANAT